jgi:hypothetical protein
MEFDLVRHPLSPAPAIRGIHVSVARVSDTRFALGYRLSGDISALVLPALAPPERADDLWKTTCFEAFLKRPDGDGYVELNFSPSTRWAAYAFDRYREGMRELATMAVPRTDMRMDIEGFELGVVLDLSGTRPPRAESDLLLGLSAVIETRDGARSYWALAHPPGDPDFHHGDCFAGLLRASGGA